MPGPANTLTGGYLYDAHLTRELRARGWTVDVHALPAGFPAPSDYARITAAQLFAELPDGELVIVDGLALGVLPEIPAVHASRLRLVALVHHPLHLESGVSKAQAERLFASERAALSRVAAVIVTGTA
ncbi:glycosyltransferase family 1 protein, partial [bacterium]